MFCIECCIAGKVEYVIIKITALNTTFPSAADHRMRLSGEQRRHIIERNFIRCGKQPV